MVFFFFFWEHQTDDRASSSDSWRSWKSSSLRPSPLSSIFAATKTAVPVRSSRPVSIHWHKAALSAPSARGFYDSPRSAVHRYPPGKPLPVLAVWAFRPRGRKPPLSVVFLLPRGFGESAPLRALAATGHPAANLLFWSRFVSRFKAALWRTGFWTQLGTPERYLLSILSPQGSRALRSAQGWRPAPEKSLDFRSHEPKPPSLMPKIGVITRTKNRPLLLKRAVQSVGATVF